MALKITLGMGRSGAATTQVLSDEYLIHDEVRQRPYFLWESLSMRNLNSGIPLGRVPQPAPRHISQLEQIRRKKSPPQSVATGYVADMQRDLQQLRNGRFGQSIVQQQIPLDAIAERFYDRTHWVSGKFQGRITTLR